MLARRRCLLLILAMALASRGALLSIAWRTDSAALTPDSHSYLAAAKSLATKGTFQTDGHPEILRTPGYPVFLAACRLTGPLGYGVAQIVQVVLDVLLVYLTYRLAARLICPAAALLAAALQALSVPAMLASVQILSDGLFSLLILATILTLVQHVRDGSWWSVTVAGAVAAAATYIRPVGLIFVPIVALVLLFRPRRLASAGSFVLVFAALVAPWFARNYLVAGYGGFSSISDHNLLFYEAAAVRAKCSDMSTQQARLELDNIYGRRLRDRNIQPDSAQGMQLQRQLGSEILLAHPRDWVVVHLTTSLASLLPAGTGVLEMLGVTSGNRGTLSVLHTEGVVAAVNYYFSSNRMAILLILPELIVLAIRYLACTTYAVRQLWLRRLNWGSAGWLIVLTILVFVFVGGPAAEPRFRLPVEPLLNIAAGVGAMMLIDRKGRHDTCRPSLPSPQQIRNQ